MYLTWFGGTVGFMIVFSVLAAVQELQEERNKGSKIGGRTNYIDSGFVDVWDVYGGGDENDR